MSYVDVDPKPSDLPHVQVEGAVKRSWRTEPGHVEKCLDEVWVAEKFQSNLEIAGSLRNSFRASLGMKNRGGRALFGLGAHPGLPNSDKLRMPDKYQRESDCG